MNARTKPTAPAHGATPNLQQILALRPAGDATAAEISDAIARVKAARADALESATALAAKAAGALLVADDETIRGLERASADARIAADRLGALAAEIEAVLPAAERRESVAAITAEIADAQALADKFCADWTKYQPAAEIIAGLMQQAGAADRAWDAARAKLSDMKRSRADWERGQLPSLGTAPHREYLRDLTGNGPVEPVKPPEPQYAWVRGPDTVVGHPFYGKQKILPGELAWTNTTVLKVPAPPSPKPNAYPPDAIQLPGTKPGQVSIWGVDGARGRPIDLARARRLGA